MSKVQIKMNVNGEDYELYVDPHKTLLDVLRNDLALTGTKKGCGAGECGACTIIMDGETVNSCLVLAPQADGAVITTIEGLEKEGKLDPVQEAFVREGGIQCGYCTPGMVMSAKALLKENPNPTEEEIRYGISGNLCRCTGYAKIVKAIKAAADGKYGARE